MKAQVKMELQKLGFSDLEIKAIEMLPHFEQFVSFVLDSEDRNRKINEAICNEYSLSTQIAILRKAIKSMGCTEEEFVKFDKRVEEIKHDIK